MGGIERARPFLAWRVGGTFRSHRENALVGDVDDLAAEVHGSER